jgi:hypothetical protein
MLASTHRRLSFSNVVSLVVLFVALGGSAYAIKKVTTRQIANSAVTAKKLRNGAVTTKKLKNNAVTTGKVADLKFQPLNLLNGWEAEGTLGAGPVGVAKDAQGIVHLRGLIRQDSGAGGVAFAFPPGLRPASATSVPASCLTLGVISAALVIDATGNVSVIATGGGSQDVCEDAGLGTSLDGVTFAAGA